MQVALVSPERILFEGEADMVVGRTSDGEIAFLTGHAPFLGALGIGAVKIVATDGRQERAAVHGGFVEVRGNRVTILSDVAELASQIDLERARAAAADAERRLMTADDVECEARLRRAHVRIAVATAT
ncbi:MAG TPA: ATP synthase F1 subunit epsilon [Acidimicrobiales bacterium]